MISPSSLQWATVQKSTSNDFPVGGMSALFGPETSDGAGPIAVCEQYPVGPVMNPIVGECLEKADALGPMVVPAMGRRLSRPAHDHFVPVPLVEGIPVLRVPSVVQGLHQLKVSLLVSH
jgi:hypothetical protein